MAKEFEGLKKRNLCRELYKAYYKNGEFTTCLVKCCVPLSLYKWNNELQKVIEKKFPLVKFYWNSELGGTCPEFTVAATCCPSNGDVYDEKMGETISYSKAQRKAYSIGMRILVLTSQWAYEKASYLEKAAAFMSMTCDREQRFIDGL